MSKVPPRKKTTHGRSSARGKSSAFLTGDRARLLLALGVVLVLAGIPFALGKYFEFNSPGPFDSGAYVYSAAHILSGAKIGIDEKPSAQLGTLLVNILGVKLWGYSDVGPKLVQMLLQLAALVLTFIALRKVFGTLAASLGVIHASIYLSSPLIAKFGNVKEQYMIAFMVTGISCFILYTQSGRWWQAVLAGMLLSWAPLFKQTGLSALGAVGLFVLLQPVLKHCSWKEMGRDVLWLLAGFAAGIVPLYVWMLGWDIGMPLPYAFVWKVLASVLPTGGSGAGAKVASGYVSGSRELVPFSEQWPIVLRYYSLFLLPIGLALGAIAARLIVMLRSTKPAKKKRGLEEIDHLVLLLALWWFLDMAFVWISPRSYEQYYLPLNASAPILGGYLACLYARRFEVDRDTNRWRVVGLLALVLMLGLSWHVFFGIRRSPHSGTIYRDYQTQKPERRRGYLQKWHEIKAQRQNGGRYAWQQVGDYIRTHSEPDDRMYVWGWYPGMYVAAQRFSSASKAVCMPRPAPAVMEQIVAGLIEEFKAEMPKFIIDSRKKHIPIERPPYELWPTMPKGFMGAKRAGFLPPDNPELIEAYDKAWAQLLGQQFDEAEAQRYKALKPLRRFIMEHYRIVNMFGPHVLFELNAGIAEKESS
ncbi:MAG: glycosyltransferase family 39 protein [Phycisphaerales bacterium]|nr:MAG: glycosyltransferase family 39 protein [Phycisphaerales bacterium]